MAGPFAGFGFTPPEQIRAKNTQVFDRAVASGDKDAVRFAIANQACNVLSG